MATQRDPGKNGEKQIQSLFEKLARGEAIFLPDKTYTSWYGIKNETAGQKFKDAWEEFCHANKHPVAELYFGKISGHNGYLLVRKNDLFWQEKSDEGFLHSL